MKKFAGMCVLALLGFAAHAATVDDVLEMTKKGDPEDKIVAAVEATPGEINVGVSDVLRLRDAKVSDKVIVALLKHTPGGDAKATAGTIKPATPPITEKKIAEQPVPVQPAAPVKPNVAVPPVQNPPVAGDGRLGIDNLDDRAWAYMYEPAVQTIWISPSTGGAVGAHASITLAMKAGSYKIRFLNSQDDGVPITVYAGEKSAFNLTRVAGEGGVALNATIFEHGERKTSGRIAALDKLAVPDAAQQPQVVEGPPVYYSDPPVYYYGSDGGPYYYYGRGYYPYYGSRYNFNFGFSSGGGHHHR
ncbi:MAG TPA: hypothetical protein VKX17_22475 [Planctomycetota bacterium]|nr:hypothetical protein [Planctomycetota bacterium]